MKYFVVIGKFAKPVEKGPAFLELLKGHHAFTAKGIEEGWVLFAGPSPQGGGIIVIKADSLEEAQARFENDPFNTEGINEYEFVEFKFFTGQEEIKGWFK